MTDIGWHLLRKTIYSAPNLNNPFKCYKTWMNLSTTNEESNIKNVELDFSTLSCQQQKSKSKMTDEFPTAVTRTCKKHWTAVLAQCDSKNMREYFSLIVLIFLQDPTFHNIFVNKVKNSHLLELYDKATQVT